MIVEVGEKLHVATRRMFEDDRRLHFAGRVREVDGTLARLEGYAFVFSQSRNEWTRRADLRTRILGLAEAVHIVHVLPPDVDLADLTYRLINGRLVVTDGSSFMLDINEFAAHR